MFFGEQVIVEDGTHTAHMQPTRRAGGKSHTNFQGSKITATPANWVLGGEKKMGCGGCKWSFFVGLSEKELYAGTIKNRFMT
jgi:hypothetical protein